MHNVLSFVQTQFHWSESILLIKGFVWILGLMQLVGTPWGIYMLGVVSLQVTPVNFFLALKL